MSRSDGSTADYYVLPEGATQLQDLISHRNMNAQIGEITRACYRYGMASHSDMLRDAKKIRFYAQAEVERLEKLSAISASSDMSGITFGAFDPSTMPIVELESDSDIPSWDDAPEWATHLMVANFDIQKDRKYQFAIKQPQGYYDDNDGSFSSRFITEGQPQLWLVHAVRPTSTAK